MATGQPPILPPEAWAAIASLFGRYNAGLLGGSGPPLYFSNASRPPASNYAIGTMVYNTDDRMPNFSDGTEWRDADGVIT